MFAKMNGSFCMLADRTSPRVQDVLAANLRRLRIARSLSLSELARATGMSKATLSSVESGRCNPTVGTIASLASALRVSLGELLEELPLGEVRVVRASQSPPESSAELSRRELDVFAPSEMAELSEMVLRPRCVHEPEPRAGGSRAHTYVFQGRLIAG